MESEIRTAESVPEPVHREAFCLMNYQCRMGCCHELIWNSRDGVTPFIIRSKRGHEMNHVRWDEDLPSRNHKPCAGERIFVDATRELLDKSVDAYIEKLWDDAEYPMREAFASKAEAKETLLASWLNLDGEPSPHLLTVERDW